MFCEGHIPTADRREETLESISRPQKVQLLMSEFGVKIYLSFNVWLFYSDRNVIYSAHRVHLIAFHLMVFLHVL